MWRMKLLWFSLLCTVSLKSERCLPLFKTDLMRCAVPSTANLLLLLFCCFYHQKHISQQGQADHSSAKAKFIQQGWCSCHARASVDFGYRHDENHCSASMDFEYYGTMKTGELLSEPQPPQEPILCRRPQSAHWYLFPESQNRWH